DDPPPALVHHSGRARTGHEPRAVLVHVHHLEEVLVARVGVVDVVVERGVVHEDVERPEVRDRRLRARLGRLWIRDAGGDADRVTLPVGLLHGPLGTFLAGLGHDDLRALAEKPLRVGEADPLARARDDRDLVLQTTHGPPLGAASVPSLYARWMRL